MDMDRYDEGVPSWVDLASPDPGAAATFYAGLFGWEIDEFSEETGGHRTCRLRGRTVAGIGPQMGPGPPAWGTYVNTFDADAVVSRVAAAGGTVLMGPFDVLDAGRMAVIADPTSAVLGLWQPGANTGAQVVNEAGSWGWSELVATDLDASATFYRAVFGWEADRREVDGVLRYAEWQVGGRSVGGALPKPPTMPASVPAHWGVYFTVEDTDATVARLVALGGSVIMAPSDIEPGRFALAADPTGAMFSVLALKS
jgi:predicted enzyme related to lactoylglutathione lyase